MLSHDQIRMIDFVRKNPNCRAIEIISGTRFKHSRVYKFLKTEFFFRSNKIVGGNTGKGGGFYYTYLVNEDAVDGICRIIKCGIPKNKTKKINVARDPITSALFGAIA